jgi:CheY-like chemotaxis protein/HPt (histidine-containing phosphotransfer) domain-containing protein
LLAEDNVVNQKVAIRILEKLGYKVDVANDGLEAYEKAKENEYDIIFMDFYMPKMDGLEATRSINKEIAIRRKPRIIAMTADTDLNNKEDCISAGMSDYINKPIRVEELREKLTKWQEVIDNEIEIRFDELKESASQSDFITEKNITFITEIQSSEDIIFLIELFEIYIRDLPILMTSIDDAVKSNDFENLKFYTHKLKGSALTLGIESIADYCLELETAAHNKVINEKVRKVNTELSLHVSKVVEELKILKEKYSRIKS